MIGEMLKSYRKLHDLGMRDVAKRIGVSVATVSRIEAGHPVDGRTMLKILGSMFGCIPCVKVDKAFIQKVSKEVEMSPLSWDSIDPKILCAAVLKVAGHQVEIKDD